MKIKHLLALIPFIYISFSLFFCLNVYPHIVIEREAKESKGMSDDTLSPRLKATIPPTADFEVNITQGCAPLEVQFHELAEAGDYAIATYRWDFGDGNSAEGQTVMHTYQNPGDYYVSLRVIDQVGNYDIKVRNNLIHVSAKPSISFTSDRFGCSTPFPTTFMDNTTSPSGDAIVDWEWDFGDGGTSEQKNPTHSFNNINYYDIRLTATDENNCSNSLNIPNYIQIFDIQPVFTVADTVCLGSSVNFTNNSSVTPGSAQHEWDFGNGDVSTNENPSYIFFSKGNKTVTLTVYNHNNTCSESYSKEIYVEQPDVAFSADTNWSCTFPDPLHVNFTDASSGNVTEWNWYFGGGNTSNEQNPSFDFTNAELVSLEVSTIHNCKNTATTFIQERKPTVSLQSDTSLGCIPLDVTFTDNSSPIFSITDWFWDFGDGGNSTDQNPAYTFNTDGEFYTKLTITDSICGDYVDSIRITPGDTIKANFIAPDSACAIEEIAFFDDSDTIKSDTWYWDFGDSATSTEQNPTHTYFNGPDFSSPFCEQDTSQITKPGIFDIIYISADNGCYDTITKPIKINGPVAFIQDVFFDCDSSLKYYFVSRIYNADKVKWTFGDGASDSIVHSTTGNYLDTIMHEYAQGEYAGIALTIFNSVSGCEQTIDYNNCTCDNFCAPTLCVRDSITAEFTVNTTKLCFDQSLHLDATASHNASEYYWYLINQDNDTTEIGTGMPENDTILTHTINNGGIYTILLKTMGCNQCVDFYKINNILSIQPYVNFTVDDSVGCQPFSVQFDTLHRQQPTDTTITSWIWQYGDGAQDTFKTYTSPNHTYKGKGYFSPTLIVTDTAGCTHSKTKHDYIFSSKPVPIFSVADRTICEKSPAVFNNFTSGTSNTYLWNFGDGNNASDYSTTHAYDTAGIYYVSLTVTDDIGCDSTVADNDSIIVQALPVAEFSSDSVVFPCYPSQVKFFFDSTYPANENVVNWMWSLGTSTLQGIKDPITTYGAPGNYDVELIVETEPEFGCRDTIQKNDFVEVGGPYLDFSVSTQAACKREPITFTYDSVFNTEWMVWHFGNLDYSDTIVPPGPNTSPAPFDYSYNNAGNYYVEVTYKDSAECLQTAYIDDYGLDYIRVHELIADFELEDTACSAPSEVQFINTSVNADTVYWDFDDGSTIDTAFNPSHTYNITGQYSVQLITKNPHNCYDTVVKTVNVHPLPYIFTSNDTIICRGDNTVLNAIDTNAYSYNWQPETFLNNSQIHNPVASPEETTDYILEITDITTCKNSDTVTIYVQQPPKVTFAYEDSEGDTIRAQNDTIFLPLGQTVMPIVIVDQQNVMLDWMEGNEDNPAFTPYSTTTYTVTATDSMECFDEVAYLVIDVSEGTVDLPTAFTPNNDGYNDIIKVNGWGIKELLEFQIYNRWGQLLFETNDINEGWDGTYKGKNQNIDTYIYSVKVETLQGVILTKSGSFSLMR